MRWPCVAVSGRRAREPSRGPEARVSVAWRAPRYRMRRGGAGLPALQGRYLGCVGPGGPQHGRQRGGACESARGGRKGNYRVAITV